MIVGTNTRDGQVYRESLRCHLDAELEIDLALRMTEVKTRLGWQSEESVALPLPSRTYGILTRASERQLVYGGEGVTPIEGCVGADLHGCPSNVHLEPWEQCRSCDRTELFLAPKPADDPRPIPRAPECRNACQWPANQGWIDQLGELGLWGVKANAAEVAVVFNDAAACRSYAAQRNQPSLAAEE